MAPIVIVRNRASSQNLVESTKLERIKLDSKSARRKEKDDKKEKRKHKSHHKHSSKKDKVVSSKKVSDESDEQRESSGLTQELGEPQKALGYLSDGSQSSKKRKRVDSPPALESTIKAEPVDGKPLKIKFVFKRSKVDESPSLPREDLPVCSTSGATSLDNREKVVQAVVKSSVPCLKQSEPKEILSLPSKSAIAVAETKTLSPVSVLDNREKVAQASVPCVKVPEPVKNLPSTSSLVETKRKKHRPSKEDRYNALFDNWDPSPICLPTLEIDSSNDDDWLFGSRRTQDKLSSRAAVQDMDMSLQNKAGEVSCWPRAQLLPEVGIYSLPYTVPF